MSSITKPTLSGLVTAGRPPGSNRHTSLKATSRVSDHRNADQMKSSSCSEVRKTVQKERRERESSVGATGRAELGSATVSKLEREVNVKGL